MRTKQMQDLMMLYGVTVGRRYTKKQKADFGAALSQQLKELGYELKAQATRNELGGRVVNLIAGNPCRAKRIYVTAYDTPPASLWRNTRYYPFHADKNLGQERKKLFFYLICCTLLCVLGGKFLIGTGGKRIAYGIGTALTALASWLLLRRRANLFNFTRNSASIAVMLQIGAIQEKREDMAFVFLDQGCASYQGWRAFKDEYPQLEGQLIVFDCIAYGEKLVAAHGANVSSRVPAVIQAFKKSSMAERLIDKSYDNDRIAQTALGFYPDMLCLSCGFVEDKEFVVKNTATKNDVQVDINQLREIADVLTEN